MGIRGRAYIAGIHEHPTRKAPDKSVAQIHAESARGALADAGLTIDDVDAYYCAGESPKNTSGGRVDLTYTGARWSGPIAFEEARVKPVDIKYASIYDSFTITVLETIEDLGFCEKGKGGPPAPCFTIAA